MALTTVKSDQIQTSVALAGSPTTTTQSASDNSTKIATTAYTDTAVANLVASAPASLNTLDELAAALNDDASFSTNVTNSIAAKLPLAGGTMTGDIISQDNRGIKFGTDSDTAIYNDGSNFYIKNNTLNQDIIFQGNDDGATGTTVLTLDMSAAGAATFNGSVTATGVTVGNSNLGSNSSHLANITLNNNGYIGSANATTALQIQTSGNAVFSGSVTAADIFLADGKKVVLGDDDDLQIFHTGGASVIADSGSGSLFIQGESQIVLGNVGNIESYAIFNTDGAVQLRHNNAQKFTTTSTGIDVTGSITSQGINSTSGTVQFADGGSSFDSSDANGYARFTQSNGSAQIGLFRSGGSAGGSYIGADSSKLLRVYNSSFASKFDIDTSGNATFSGNVNAGAGLRLYTDGSNNAVLYALGQNKSMYFAGDDAGVGINALILDMANGGNATFSGSVTAADLLKVSTNGSSAAEVDIVSGATWTVRSNPTSGTNSYGLDIIKGSAGTDVKMSINSSGEVLIGNTLHLFSGNARSEVSMDSAGSMFFKANDNTVNAASSLVFQAPIVAGSGTLETKMQITNTNIVNFDVREYYERIYVRGNTAYTWDIDVKSIGASGQILEIFAGWTHYAGSYAAVLKQIWSHRSTVQSDVVLIQSLVNYTTSNAGAWSVSWVDADTIRLTKSAGSHGGYGWGYILVRGPD